MSCVQTINTICKHVEASDTYYVDLEPLLGTSETVSSVTSVTPVDTTLTAASAAVLSSQTTVTNYSRDLDGNTTTTTYVIAANKGISFTLSGGATGAGCSVITVIFVKSSGKTDAVDCLIEIEGVDVA